MNEASYSNQLVNLKKYLIEGNSSEEEAIHFYACLLLDCASEDTIIRNKAKEVLTEWQVEGDSYGVPAIEDIVNLLVDEIKMLRNKQ